MSELRHQRTVNRHGTGGNLSRFLGTERLLPSPMSLQQSGFFGVPDHTCELDRVRWGRNLDVSSVSEDDPLASRKHAILDDGIVEDNRYPKRETTISTKEFHSW